MPPAVSHWVGALSVLWTVLGAYISGLWFLSSTQPITDSQEYGQVVAGVDSLPAWLGGAAPTMWDAQSAAVWVCLALAIPLLFAGRARLRAWERGRWLWTGAWTASLALMAYSRICLDTLPSTTTCTSEDGCYAVPYSGPALVNWRELAISVAFIAIAATMATLVFRSEAGPPGCRGRSLRRPGEVKGSVRDNRI
jgi:hypothetical protein